MEIWKFWKRISVDKIQCCGGGYSLTNTFKLKMESRYPYYLITPVGSDVLAYSSRWGYSLINTFKLKKLVEGKKWKGEKWTRNLNCQMTSVLFAASCVHMSLAHSVSAFQPAWYGERTNEFMPSRELRFRHTRHVNTAARAMTCTSAQRDARWRDGFLQQHRRIKKGLCVR